MSADSPGNGGTESATATCPGTKVMVGAGYRISNVLGAAKVYLMRPNGDAASHCEGCGTSAQFTLGLMPT